MSRRRLTPDQLDRAAELRAAGATVPQLCRELGCKPGALNWAFLTEALDPPHARPLPPVPTTPKIFRSGDRLIRRFTAAEDARLLHLESRGFGPAQIGRLMAPRRRASAVITRLRTLARRDARAEASLERTA